MKLREHLWLYAIFRRDLLQSPQPELEKPVVATQTNEGITTAKTQQMLERIACPRPIYRITTAKWTLLDFDLVAPTHSRLRESGSVKSPRISVVHPLSGGKSQKITGWGKKFRIADFELRIADCGLRIVNLAGS